MGFGSLVLANLLRNPLRLAFATISLFAAFLLLMLLQSIASKFDTTAEPTETLLLAQAKYTSAYMLPTSAMETIRKLANVRAATPMLSFFAYFQETANSFQAYVVDAKHIEPALENVTIDTDHLKRFQETRTGALVSPRLAEQYGWRVGDRVPISSSVYPQAESSDAWPFEIVGFLRPKQKTHVDPTLILRYDYFNENTRFNKYKASFYWIVADNPANASRVAANVDQTLSITDTPIKTTTQDYVSRSWARRLGDIGTITGAILGAVFFSVLIVTGNTAAQAMKERLGEFAAMKTLGFSDPLIAGLMFAENLMICLICSMLAIGAAFLLEPTFNEALGQYVGRFEIAARGSALTITAAMGTAIAISVLPTIDTIRLSVVDALRRD